MLRLHRSLKPSQPRASGARVLGFWAGGWLAAGLGASGLAAQITPVVEVEENVYAYENAQNGTDPLWALGPTCLVRWQDRVFASGLQTMVGVSPQNNCRWLLFGRVPDSATNTALGSRWPQPRAALLGTTREPCPLGVTTNGHLYLSTHRAMQGSGSTQPVRFELVQFPATNLLGDRLTLDPTWRGESNLGEYSHRSLAADGRRGDLVLFLNGGAWGGRWGYLNPHGIWAASGELRWPWGNTYERPASVRLTHAQVLLRDGAVHYCGVSELEEPVSAWRDFKRQSSPTGPDLVSRRLFYTRCPDIERGLFEEWIEVANCDPMSGTIIPGDLWVDSSGIVHVVWTESTPDERLRDKFFPNATPRQHIQYARLRRGSVLSRRSLVLGGTAAAAERPSHPRFHVLPDQRLFVFYAVTATLPGGGLNSENRLVELQPDGSSTAPITVPLAHPLTRYYTASPRAGSPLSDTLDLLGCRAATPLTISYARVRLR